jgi:CRP/FNR family transcriptional regulator, cyclic AMP receptor protein
MAEIDAIVEVLERTPLFRGLRPRQLEGLAKRFVEREYEPGQVIVAQGKGGEGFFIIVKGKAEAIHARADGTTVVLNSLGPSQFFGEMALLAETMRSASVVATEPTQCIVLTRWDFLSVLRADADMAVAILQELAGRFTRVLSTM